MVYSPRANLDYKQRQVWKWLRGWLNFLQKAAWKINCFIGRKNSHSVAIAAFSATLSLETTGTSDLARKCPPSFSKKITCHFRPKLIRCIRLKIKIQTNLWQSIIISDSINIFRGQHNKLILRLSIFLYCSSVLLHQDPAESYGNSSHWGSILLLFKIISLFLEF